MNIPDRRRERKGFAGKPRFIVDGAHAENKTQVTVRVPQSTKDNFEAAQKVLRKNNLDMSLATVIRVAMEDAARIVEERFGCSAAVNNQANDGSHVDNTASAV